MKEYKVLRELEPTQPAWAGESTRERLETNINELARSGWVVRSFRVSQPTGGTGFGFGYRPANFAYFVLLERERADTGPRK
ncbi:MAG: hypothetical protein WB947_06660 [Thermoplasmata archaeon]